MSDKISLSEVCTRWRAPAEDIFSLVFKEYGFSFFYNGLEFSPENERSHLLYNLSKNNEDKIKEIKFIKDNIDYIENNNSYIKHCKDPESCFIFEEFDYFLCARSIKDEIVSCSIDVCLQIRDIINATNYIIKKEEYKGICDNLLKIYMGDNTVKVDTYVFEKCYDKIYDINKYKRGKPKNIKKPRLLKNVDTLICKGIKKLKKINLHGNEIKTLDDLGYFMHNNIH